MYVITEQILGTVVAVVNERIEATYLVKFLPKKMHYNIAHLPEKTSEINFDFLKGLSRSEFNKVMSAFDKKNQKEFNKNPLFPA